jgi:hypothetical protein
MFGKSKQEKLQEELDALRLKESILSKENEDEARKQKVISLGDFETRFKPVSDSIKQFIEADIRRAITDCDKRISEKEIQAKSEQYTHDLTEFNAQKMKLMDSFMAEIDNKIKQAMTMPDSHMALLCLGELKKKFEELRQGG